MSHIQLVKKIQGVLLQYKSDKVIGVTSLTIYWYKHDIDSQTGGLEIECLRGVFYTDPYLLYKI